MSKARVVQTLLYFQPFYSTRPSMNQLDIRGKKIPSLFAPLRKDTVINISLPSDVTEKIVVPLIEAQMGFLWDQPQRAHNDPSFQGARHALSLVLSHELKKQVKDEDVVMRSVTRDFSAMYYYVQCSLLIQEDYESIRYDHYGIRITPEISTAACE